MNMTLKLISADAAAATAASAQETGTGVLQLANDVDPRGVSMQGIERIDLHFPKFSDGRAFSQAFLLRRRLGFAGDIRATGDVLIDQLVQMQRTGFTSAVLRADQDTAHALRQFERYPQFYQGDAVNAHPLSARQLDECN